MASNFWSDYSPTLTIGGAASSGMDIYFKSDTDNFVKVNGHYIGTSQTYYGVTSGESTKIPITFTPSDNYKTVTVTTTIKNDNGKDTNSPSVSFGVKKATTTLHAEVSGTSSIVNTSSTVRINISGFSYVENNIINGDDFSVSSNTPGIYVTYFNSYYPIDETYYTVTIPISIGASSKTVNLTTKFKPNVLSQFEKTANTELTIHQLATGVGLTLTKDTIYTSQSSQATATFSGYATPFNNGFKWSLVTRTGSTDSTHATLSSYSGSSVTIRPKQAGEVYVKVTSADNAVSKTSKLTINNLGVASITPSTVTLNPNGDATLTAKGFNSTPSWSVSSNIISISGSGNSIKITASASGSGSTTVTASNTLGQNAASDVTVKFITLSIA